MLAKKYPQLKKPIKCTKRMGLLESIRDYQFHRNLAREDEICLHLQWKEDGMAEGKEIGIAQGLEQGREQAYKDKLSIARNLLAEGSTPEFVQKITGLPLKEIIKL